MIPRFHRAVCTKADRQHRLAGARRKHLPQRMESRVKLFIGERRQPAGVLELHLLRHEERTILMYAAGCVFRTFSMACGPWRLKSAASIRRPFDTWQVHIRQRSSYGLVEAVQGWRGCFILSQQAVLN